MAAVPRIRANAFGDLTLAVIVGVSVYDDTRVRRLPACAPETRRLVTALTNPTGCRVPDNNVNAFVDDTATRDDVLAALKARSSAATPDQILIFYFAGHGEPMEKGFALLLRDTVLDDLARTALTSTDLDEVFSGCQARGVLMILDCCGGAALAENAPGFTQRIGQHEFRILLSASRARQSSWETPKGSLFTRHFLDVVEGKVQISKEPGEVYFNDLLTHLRLCVADEIDKSRGQLPPQEPVFNGGYVGDPLIFLHTDESLKQLRVRVQRYSQAYLQQRIRRTVGAALAAVALTLGGYWLLLDQHYYLEAGDKSIAVMHGYPGLTGLGYPKRVWTIEMERSKLASGSPLSAGKPVVFRRGAAVAPIVGAELSPVGQALWHFWAGEIEAARQIAQQGMTGTSNDRPNDWFEFAQLFAAAAASADLDALEKLSQHQNPSVSQGAIRALARLDQLQALRALTKRGFDINQVGIHLEALQLWDPPCSAELRNYLNDFAKAPAYGQFTRATVLAALRAECVLEMDPLIGSQTAYQGAVATYWVLQGGADAKRLAADLQGEIGQTVRALATSAQPVPLDRIRVLDPMIEMALALPTKGCPLAIGPSTSGSGKEVLAEYRQFASALDRAIGTGRPTFTRARLAALVATACANIDVTLNIEQSADRNSTISLNDSEGGAVAVASFRVGPSNVPIEVMQLADQVRRANQIPQLATLLATNADAFWKSRLVRRLRLIGAPAVDVSALFSRGDQELQVEAYLWQAARDQKSALDGALGRLGDPTAAFLPDVLVALVGDAASRARVIEQASGSVSDEARRTALVVLFGTSHQAAEKLLDADASVRAAAIDYLDFRDDLDEVAALVRPRLREPLPAW